MESWKDMNEVSYNLMWKEALLLFIYTLIVMLWGGLMFKKQDLSLESMELFKLKGLNTIPTRHIFCFWRPLSSGKQNVAKNNALIFLKILRCQIDPGFEKLQQAIISNVFSKWLLDV